MIHIGTSGWHYDSWRGVLYDAALPKRCWLERFSAVFPTVEINNTFYRLPKAETFDAWKAGSADDFTFTVKASRFITHIRRLKDASDAVQMFWERAERLRPKLGVVLFQTPPNLQADPDVLRRFVAALPTGMRSAFEFRHSSWDVPDVRKILDDAGAAWVLADRPGARVAPVVTGGWSYIRFHEGRPGRPHYTRDKLRRWADRIAELDSAETWIYFNNDPEGAAVRDAVTLTELLYARVPREVRGPRAPEIAA